MSEQLKRSAALLDHSFGWDAELRVGVEAIAADLGWWVEPDTRLQGGMTVRATRSTTTTTTAFLAGGLPGEAYRLSNRVRTTFGREIERRTTIRIGNS